MLSFSYEVDCLLVQLYRHTDTSTHLMRMYYIVKDRGASN